MLGRSSELLSSFFAQEMHSQRGENQLIHPPSSREGGFGSPDFVNAFLGQSKNLEAQINALVVLSRGMCRTHGISNWLLHTRLAFNRKLEFVVFSSSR